MAETHAIKNAGAYIREIEDAEYKNSSGSKPMKMGWENYVKIKGAIYKPFEYAADVIFGSLYIFCVIGAWVWYYYKRPYYISCAIFYLAMGVYVLIAAFWLHRIRKDELNNSKKGIENVKAPKNEE
jgi:hypothetical protein